MAKYKIKMKPLIASYPTEFRTETLPEAKTIMATCIDLSEYADGKIEIIFEKVADNDV